MQNAILNVAMVILRETPLTFYAKCNLFGVADIAMTINFIYILQPYFVVLALLVFSCMRVLVCVSQIFLKNKCVSS